MDQSRSVLRSATHKLLKRATEHLSPLTTKLIFVTENSGSLCASLLVGYCSSPFSELYELHVNVVFAKLHGSHSLSCLMFLPAVEAKILGK